MGHRYHDRRSVTDALADDQIPEPLGFETIEQLRIGLHTSGYRLTLQNKGKREVWLPPKGEERKRPPVRISSHPHDKAKFAVWKEYDKNRPADRLRPAHTWAYVVAAAARRLNREDSVGYETARQAVKRLLIAEQARIMRG